MRIAVTADLHWGHNAAGDAATRLMVQRFRDQPPDVLLLGGDIGAGEHFGSCLSLFDEFHCQKALVPGNHDLWVQTNDARGDSLHVYERHLPDLCGQHQFQYLDQAPLILCDRQLAVVGTINWYDYTWSLAQLKLEVPDWEARLQNMAFTRGRHNDRRFVRWELNDVEFTRRVVAVFEAHLASALVDCERVLVMTHHPALYGLSFPRPGPPSVPDGLLWDAFSGNTAIEEILRRHADRLALILSGHTHRARENELAGCRAINIGGDYHFKRLIEFDWPTGATAALEFGHP